MDAAGNSIIQLTLIRHGATDANKEHRYLGKTDESLSQEGTAEILSLWKDGISADLLFYSPMKRCMETVELIFHARMIQDPAHRDLLQEIDLQKRIPENNTPENNTPENNIPCIPISEWTEMDFGEFEMKNYRDLNGNPSYQAWIDSGGTLAFPGGESQEQMIRRVMDGFKKVFLPEIAAANKSQMSIDNKNAENYIVEENVAEDKAFEDKALEDNVVEECIAEENTIEDSAAEENTIEGSAAEENIVEDRAAEDHAVHACAIVHGGTIMALMHGLTGKPYFDFQVKNGHGYTVLLTADGKIIRVKEKF